jgi:imidazolonepropionase-like amidohydrolase
MIRARVFAAALLLIPLAASAQTRPVEGLREKPVQVHALTGARIVLDPGDIVEQGTVVIRQGVIEAVGPDVTPPPDARIWELDGYTIYPGFIDAHAELPLENATRDEKRGAAYWNPQVRPELVAADRYTAEDDQLQTLRSQGLTVAMVVPRRGIYRGQTAVVSLGEGDPRDQVLQSPVAQSLSLVHSRQLGGDYPISSMGAIALIRQVLLDAQWYRSAQASYSEDPVGRRPERNDSLAALAACLDGRQPVLMEVRNELELLRALRLAEEFSIQPWIRSSGREYLIVEELKEADVPLIVPVNFPAPPSAASPEAELDVRLETLRHWHLAAENPGRMAQAGIEFSLTSDGSGKELLGNVRRAVRRGLDADTALAALTTVPARLLGIEATHGTLAVGKVANLVVANGDLFQEDNPVIEVWIDGRRYETDPRPSLDPRGSWEIAIREPLETEGTLQVHGRPGKLSGRLTVGEKTISLRADSLRAEAGRLRFAFDGTSLNQEGIVRFSASVSQSDMYGWGQLPDGNTVNWRGRRKEGPPNEPKEPSESDAENAKDQPEGDEPSDAEDESTEEEPAAEEAELDRVKLDLSDIWPPIEFGRPALPPQPKHLLIRNATIWTMGPDGILDEADLLVQKGRIVAVGRELEAPDGRVETIDATGMHVTPGLIDPHLHSGISGGVNETGAAVVPEVRIGDVLDTNTVWTYRQVAGGLTAAHVMHGSANPIGGQNQVIKMRWGARPEQLKFEGAPRTVKFALGENVKRRSGRYPDTRLGVEQIIRDSFDAAREYRTAWEEWEKDPVEGDQGHPRPSALNPQPDYGIPPRRDLRMEALSEILDGEILIHSHCYRQDEILMLMRVAEEFGVRVRAFHHTVEGYRVAPELAAHGAAAVIWSDWSSFKVESYNATTYNARLLLQTGVLTSLHSDNSQIASRMNREAAKLLRTGLLEEQALGLVTLQPARILGIDDRVGSLEAGKDADFVLWAADPLSAVARVEQTWIDGRRYFDREEDRALQRQVAGERARLMQLVLKIQSRKSSGGGS